MLFWLAYNTRQRPNILVFSELVSLASGVQMSEDSDDSEDSWISFTAVQ